MLMVFIVAGCAVDDAQEHDPGTVPGETLGLPDMDQTTELDNLPEIVATVNGEPITREEITQLDLQNQQMFGFSISVEEMVNQILSQRVLMQMVDEKNYDFNEQDVENFFIENGFEVNELRQEVEMMGMDYNQFLYDYIDELKFANYLSEIEQDITVTQQEMEEFYEEQKMFFEEDVTYEEIQEDIYYFLLEQKTEEILITEIENRLEHSEVEFFY